MKNIVSILVLSVIAIAVCYADQSSTSTNSHPDLTRARFVYVEPSPEQQKTLDVALTRLNRIRVVGKIDKTCTTIEEARHLIYRQINIAAADNMRAATEYKGFFCFSRLERAGHDDGTFKSGVAVRKGTAEVYDWGEDEAKPANGANAALSHRSN